MNRGALKKRLTLEEGERLVAYLDTEGILTVGIGHNCEASSVEGVTKPGDRITPETEQALFDADVDEAAAQLDVHLPWWRDLDDARQNVLLDMCFNMGIKTLKTFVNALGRVEAGDYEAAADGMLASKWASQVKGRATWLANVMRTGVYA